MSSPTLSRIDAQDLDHAEQRCVQISPMTTQADLEGASSRHESLKFSSRARFTFPRTNRLLLVLLASVCLLPAPAATPPAVGEMTAPAINWVLPIFTDKEGFRSMTLRGSEVRPVGRSIAVTDLSIAGDP